MRDILRHHIKCDVTLLSQARWVEIAQVPELAGSPHPGWSVKIAFVSFFTRWEKLAGPKRGVLIAPCPLDSPIAGILFFVKQKKLKNWNRTASQPENWLGQCYFFRRLHRQFRRFGSIRLEETSKCQSEIFSHSDVIDIVFVAKRRECAAWLQTQNRWRHNTKSSYWQISDQY